MDLLKHIQFDQNGLLPVIVQEYDSGEILMFAWMNQAALELSLKNKEAVYFSRSRQKLWHKGEQSGHKQTIVSFCLDCDQDVLLIKIKQHGGIACHTGRKSCFFQQIENDTITINQNIIKTPEQIYGN